MATTGRHSLAFSQEGNKNKSVTYDITYFSHQFVFFFFSSILGSV